MSLESLDFCHRPSSYPHRSFTLIALCFLPMLLAGCGALNVAPAGPAAPAAPMLPVITVQPLNATVSAGQMAAFSVTATGSGDVSYQWQVNSVAIQGATAATYTIPAAKTSDNGVSFTVVVSNSAGSTTSAAATLLVSAPAPPVIAAQPEDQTVPIGQSATFSVVATGTGALTYQWRKNGINLASANLASYSTMATTSADSGSMYDVIVTDAAGSTTSSTAGLTVSIPQADSYFVALNGSDSADGSSANPFATLQRAQLAMQQSTIKVTQINAGTYYLQSPLALSAADQGETWQSVPGATVVISGGEVLTGWKSEGSGIYSANAPLPVGLDLTVSGVRQVPAALGYDPQRPFISGWRVLNPNQAQLYGTTFSVQPGDITASVKPGAIVQTVDSLRYTDNFTTIVSVNSAQNTITVADPFYVETTATGVTGSWRVLNDAADLGATGEFAYNASSATVYVEPADPDTLNSDTIVAAQLATLISLNQVSGVTINGLTFSDTTSDRNSYSGAFTDKLAALMGAGLTNCTFTGNTFLNAGNGISLAASSNNSIAGNLFTQMGGAGIFLFANSNHNQVTNNAMNGLGKINVGSTGIHLENSANNLIDSNTIDGSGRWGIDLMPTDGVSLVGNTVSNNIIRNTSQQTNDTGPIYSYAGDSPSYVDEDTTITGNRLENPGGLLRDGSGNFVLGQTQGIYMDDQVSGITMTNNVVESDGNGMFLCHGCRNNSASNNVIVLQPAAFYDRGSNGVTYAAGAMSYNGVTRVDLLPSYFPAALTSSTIVVQLSGLQSGSTSATFNVQADGVVIGNGTATGSVKDFIFSAQLAPHQTHRIGIALLNGVTTGAATTGLQNMALFVNNTAVQLDAPEAKNSDGAYGFVVGNDNLQVSHFSATHNIVYRMGGLSQNLMDWTDWTNPSYVDPNPGSVDSSVLYQNVAKAGDTVLGNAPLDADSILSNPMFNNAASGDYTLQANSPAFAVGFTTAGAPLAP